MNAYRVVVVIGDGSKAQLSDAIAPKEKIHVATAKMNGRAVIQKNLSPRLAKQERNDQIST